MNANQTKEIRDGGIEAGLICLAAIQRPGQHFTHRDIARVCGCSRGLIYLIEIQALKKLRLKLRKELGLTFGELAAMKASEL